MTPQRRPIFETPFVPMVQKVPETILRVGNIPLNTGQIRYVDGSNSTGNASNSNSGLSESAPKLTIGSAEAAITDGGIVELISSIDLKNEVIGATGYVMLNNSNKSILIRGKSGLNITVTHTGAAGFIFRMRDTSKVQFQNINFSHAKSNELIYCECDSPTTNVTKWIKFKKCNFDFQNAASNGIIRPVNITVAGTGNIFYELDECTLPSTKGPGWKWIQTDGLPNTATILLTNNTMTSDGFQSFSTGENTKVKTCFYNNTINQNYGGTVLAFSSDTNVPAQTGQVIDLRENILSVGAGFDPHGILFGRGTSSIYCVNNILLIPPTASSLAIGFVIKTTSANLGDSYFGGNYIIAPRPFYIKGGSKVTATFNSCISNWAARAAFDIDNPIEADSPNGINSTQNVITDNTFIGNTYGVQLLNTAAVQKPATSMQGWVMDRNNYYGTNSVFLFDSNNNTPYYLAYKRDFWVGNNNDYKSRGLKSRIIK